MSNAPYRGRVAPSPTGYLHLGHARTFWMAQQRARSHHGALILRNEDLDPSRCRTQYVEAMVEDLRWLGLEWSEGPDCSGPHTPYTQSLRLDLYRAAFETLRLAGLIYPCSCSRSDVLRSVSAPHPGDDEPLYPGTCRPATPGPQLPQTLNWRFRVPDGRTLKFEDQSRGWCAQTAGTDFGDFLVWRKDGLPSYQLACVVDDLAMGITEVVRGEDLIASTFRQWLLYEAFNHQPPAFFHCPLVTDERGVRLAKRHDALSLRQLRAQGISPQQLQLQLQSLS